MSLMLFSFLLLFQLKRSLFLVSFFLRLFSLRFCLFCSCCNFNTFLRFCPNACFQHLLFCFSMHPFRISFLNPLQQFQQLTEFQTKIVFLNIFLHFYNLLVLHQTLSSPQIVCRLPYAQICLPKMAFQIYRQFSICFVHKNPSLKLIRQRMTTREGLLTLFT